MASSYYHITRESRIIGALLGVHAGDSLGAALEFQSHAQIAKKYPNGLDKITGGGIFSWPAGHATDDTDMTRGVLLAYSTVRPHQDVAIGAGKNFLKWWKGDWPARKLGSGPVDIGQATATGLRNFEKSGDPNKSGAGRGSAGNGSLMRCIPTGLFQTDQAKLIAESKRISRITHDDPRCTISCAVYNWITAELIKGTKPRDAVKSAEALAEQLEGDQQKRDAENKIPAKDTYGNPVLKALQSAKRINLATLAITGPPLAMFKDQCGGYVIETLILAVAAILDERPLKDVLVDVIRLGRDTDTNGAVAGGLLGARDGEEAIPKEWRNILQFGGEFRALALLILEKAKTAK